MPDKIKSKYQFTGDIDDLTLKGGNPFNAYWGDKYLTPQIIGDTIAYSDGENIWRVPLNKIYPVNDDDLTPQQRLERDWRKSPAYGIDKVILGTLAGTMAPFVVAEAAPALAGLATGASDAAMATRAGQAAYQGLTSPVGKAALSSIFGGMGAHNFFSDNGYAKTLQEWNNLKNDPNFYNAVNFGKSAAGDIMDVTMMAPLYKPLTYAGKEAWNLGKQGMTFMNSPLTGNWATFGNKQYRFNPNSLGSSGTPIESRNLNISASDRAKEIKISPEELYKLLQEQEGYYFLGHGTGRNPGASEAIFNSGLRTKTGDVGDTTIPLSESNLASWPHLNSEEVGILPGKVDNVKYDYPYGRIPTDWFDTNTFNWNDNPGFSGRGLMAQENPHASFTESIVEGIPGVYTKPEAVLGSYNTRTHTLRLNPNSQYKFSFGETSNVPKTTEENAANVTIPQDQFNIIRTPDEMSQMSRFQGESPIPHTSNDHFNAGYYWKQRSSRYNPETEQMETLVNLDEVPNLKETINSIIERIPDAQIRPEFLDSNYINGFRQHASMQGVNVSNLSNEDIAKILTEQYNQLSSTSSGLVKDNVFWRNWGRVFPQRQFDWQSHMGESAGNNGFWGQGNYFASGRYNTSTGNPNAPYMINGIKEIGYDDLLGATEKAGDAMRQGGLAGEPLATKWMSESPDTRLVAATPEGFRNNYGWIDNNNLGIEVVTQKNTGIKSLYPDLTIGNGTTFPRDWTNSDVMKAMFPWLAGAGATGTLYGISQDNTHAYGGPLISQANVFGDGSWLSGIKSWWRKSRQKSASPSKRKTRWNTTSGMGYVPNSNIIKGAQQAAYNYLTGGLPVDTVRQRLYDNLHPVGYQNAVNRFRRSVIDNIKEKEIEDGGYDPFRDAIFAEYLSIPAEKRHKQSQMSPLRKSQYSPSKNKDKSTHPYYAVDLTDYEKKLLYDSAKGLGIGESGVFNILGHYFGDHTISRGKDDKGEYVSYYDLWDLSPITKDNGKDESLGIGNPLHFYDRIYFDEINNKAQGGPLVAHANMFEIGGPKKKVRWNTTGGAGYIPPTTGLSMSDVRERLYNNMTPFDYDRPVGRFADAVLANRKDEFIRDDGYLKTADDAWATYLNIPQDKRHNIPGKIILEKSPYYPANTYRMKNLSPEAQQTLVDDMQGRQVAFDENIKAYYPEPLKVGEHKITYSPDEDIDNNLRSFTLGRGYDDKGDYAYYRDKFDIAPFGKHEGDQSMGIGTPFTFYDRIYLDDFYGVDSPTHALYLPEVEVEGKKKHSEGGSLNAYKSWDNLSIKEKSEMMKVAIRNGITNLADIKAKYNEFAEGGYMTSEEDDDVNMYDGISQTSQQMQQRYIYDILPRLYAMDGVNVVLSSGLRPNAVVYQNGKPTGRKSRHGSGQAADIVPVKGTTFADIFRVLHDPNSNVSRWMRANNAGYVDETSATGTTKYWHDHNRDHSHVHHQIGGNPASQYAARFGNSVSSVGNYRDIAKQHIRQNEGWSATPYADGPNGWRSVGYGFNDSGFRAKYPGGIANYYAQRGGITKAEAERELDWFLNNMEASLRKTYGRRWDSFSDNQKAAIMDTAYQRPASVDAKSAFYAAVMSGNPNAGNLLGVKGFDKRNADRRNLFSSSAVQAMNPQNYGQQQPQMAHNPFEGWEPSNPQAFYIDPKQMEAMERLTLENAQMKATLEGYKNVESEAAEIAARNAERETKRRQSNFLINYIMGDNNDSSSLIGGLIDLSNNPEADMWKSLVNMGAYGGHLYDGETEPTQQMKKRYYETVPTGITDKIVQQGGDPLKARLEDGTELSVEDMGNYYAYSNGDSVWRVPKVEGTLLSDLSNVSVQEEENNDFTNAWSGGAEGLIKPEYYNPKINPFGQILRDRMYKKVVPEGYTTENIRNFLWGNDRDNYLDLNTEALFGKYTGQDSIYGYAYEWPNIKELPGREVKEGEVHDVGAGIDRRFRKAAVSDILKPSSIKEGAYELLYPYPAEIPDRVDKRKQLHNRALGTYTVQPGEDENRKYLDYMDRWDLNPYIGYSKQDDDLFSMGPDFGLKKKGNIVPWGLPFDIYGRIYQEPDNWQNPYTARRQLMKDI